jgi:glycosyltransferase involved in cell wall biosynthesis
LKEWSETLESYHTKFSNKTLDKIQDLSDYKFLFAFNLANDFVPFVKLFREFDFKADILIQKITNNVRFTDPLWEDRNFNRDWIIEWSKPTNRIAEKIHVLQVALGFRCHRLNQTSLKSMAKQYDIILSTPPGPVIFYNLKNSIIYDGGWAREFSHQKQIRYRLAMKAYQEKNVIFTNPDMIDIFRRIGCNPTYIPFAVEYDKYTSQTEEKIDQTFSEEFTVYNPTRNDFHLKGTHHLINGFAKAIANNSHMKLVLTNWGKDVLNSKKLIRKLNIENNVKWIEPIDKQNLIKRINNSTVIADQFVIGSYGLAAPEAMACEKAVLMYLKNDKYKEFHNGQSPPIVNCKFSDEIAIELEKLQNVNYRNKIEKKARSWVIQEHNPAKVFEQQIDLFHDQLRLGKH